MSEAHQVLPSTPPRKRRRIPLACTNCRDRKTRCNGESPVCSTCIRRREQDSCLYEGSSLLRAQSRNRASREDVTSIPGTPLLSSQKENSFPSGPGHGHPLTHKQPPQGIESPRTDGSQSTTSKAQSNASMASHPQNNIPLYGASSNVGLLSQIRQAATAISPVADRVMAVGSGDTMASSSNACSVEIFHNQDTSAFLLPPRKTSDDFLKCYWEFMHPVFPILHKPTFLANYTRLWTSLEVESEKGSALEETIFHISLNLVFALGCQFSTTLTPAKKSSFADEFYQRSRKLVNFEILDAMELSLVQVLLLTAVYLQSTECANRCWNVVGLAIRAAQSLGLHFNEATINSTSQIDREMRRRVWHTCVLFDRLLSMTCGRPMMISGSWDVKTPSIIDDEYLLEEGEGFQPQGLPSQINLFVYSLQLFDIMAEILSTFYIHDNVRLPFNRTRLDPWSPGDLINVLNINSKLDRFDDTLPDILRPGAESKFTDQPWHNHIMLQSKILNFRFLYTRILLLRSVLLAAAKEQACSTRQNDEPRLQQDLAVGACTLCVKTAHKLLAEIHGNLATSYRSSGWHTVYFAFAAGTILIAAHLCPLVEVNPQDVSFRTSWSNCMAILEYHKAQIPSVARAIISLDAMKRHVQGIPGEMTRSINDTGPMHDSGMQYLGREDLGLEPLMGPPDLNYPYQFGINDLEPPSMDSIDNAWFVHQLADLEWLKAFESIK